MAKLTNTFTTTDAKLNRESLSNIVNKITPEDTPLYSAIGTEKVASKSPEWGLIENRAAGVNVNAEGDEYIFNTSVVAERLTNHTQIYRDSFIMSATQIATKNAGNTEEFNKNKLMKAMAVKRDVELSMVSNIASNASETGRIQGGVPTFIKTNVSRGAGGVNGGYNSGTKLTVTATNGTQRAMTKAQIDAVCMSIYNNGGDLNMLMVSPYLKTVFSSFLNNADVAPLRIEADAKTPNVINSSIGLYNGDFGLLKIVPNRVMASSASVARNALLLDPKVLKKLVLRPIQEDAKVAKTGDGQKYVVIGEQSLKVENEKGLGIVADLFGMSAVA